MKKRILALCLLSSLTASCLSGCGSYDEVDELKNLAALNSEASVSNSYNLSYTDEQEMIYAQVSDRTLLDLSTLDACTDSEVSQVVDYMGQVDYQLIGTVKPTKKDKISGIIIGEDTGAIDTSFTDYLLSEFQKTPYYWQRQKTIIRGIDSKSRSIIVDVTYHTIDYKKEVKPDSSIVMGEPNYSTLVETRYNHYLSILNLKYNNPDDESLPAMIEEFKSAYGEPEEIYKSQSNDGLTDAIYATGNQRTYGGMINSAEEQTGATMTVRYILVPKYVLGINLGMTCEHMYVTNYTLDKDCTEGKEPFVEEGYATVSDSVYELIYSYFTCIDEGDFSGLYKLTYDFGSLDKYYKDMFDTTYSKHNNFSLTLFDIKGSHITCGVSISSKIRAKGSNMTYPNYTDRYYFEIELIDGELQVKNMVLLSRVLEGEPAITADSADTSGFSASIELNNDDRVAIEKLICDFSSLQLLKDTTSDSFGDTVDLAMSTSMLSALEENMASLSGVNKVVWLQNYQQGSSNYASVKCRELFQDEDNSITEAEVTYEFILKGGKWYVYGYTINSSVKLDTTNLSTTGSLCLVTPGKVEAYTSQIKNSASSTIDNAVDTSKTYNHEAYEPVLKTGQTEQGLNKLTADQVTAEIFGNYIEAVKFNELDSLVEIMTKSGIASEDANTIKKELLQGVAVCYNLDNNRYSKAELADIRSVHAVNWKEFGVKLSSTSKQCKGDDKAKIEAISEAFSTMSRRIK